MQDEITHKVNNLEKELDKLLTLFMQSKKMLQKQQEENLLLKNIIEKQNEQLNNFQNQDKISNIVNSLELGSESPEELKQQIETYIHKLDNCIAYLSKQLSQ
jgi:hypothetical protein